MKPKHRKPEGQIHLNIDPEAFRRIALERDDQMFAGMLEGVGTGDDGAMGGIFTMMALQCLVEAAKGILGTEWCLRQSAPTCEHRARWERELEQERARFAVQYEQVRDKLGAGFDAGWEEIVGGHNECARLNLDNSKGLLFCYVIPRFSPDGTHDPVGEKDGPWGQHYGNTPVRVRRKQ